jgi:putative membrane protein
MKVQLLMAILAMSMGVTAKADPAANDIQRAKPNTQTDLTEGRENPPKEQNTGKTEAVEKTSRMQEGEILSFLEAINNHEIKAAKIALKKQISAQALSYAKMMKKDHTKNLKATQTLSKTTGIEFSESAAIIAFRAKAAGERALMMPLKGDKFEASYANSMVKGHEEVLDMIDHKFMPNANNEDLKKHLVTTRAAVLHHLEEAKTLQGSSPLI